MRVGIGYDAHRLVEGRSLILGGIKIPFEKGLLGHSDADVLIHSVCDALLGAAGEGDLGKHFPDSDPKYKGISSLKLLSEVNALMKIKGFALGNIDVTIVCQAPKLATHIEKMKNNLSDALNAPTDLINIKATTTEGMGFTGEGKGVSSYCIAMIKTEFNFQ